MATARCDDVDQDDGGDEGDRAQVVGSTGASSRATRVTGDIWSMVEKKARERNEGNMDMMIVIS